ncbi:MAG TPA: DUF5077 domain-containing protein, partial [Flavisolibacter sp.]|nr:DUF5077 domain-containing protein [Flavisolibacter sp.]
MKILVFFLSVFLLTTSFVNYNYSVNSNDRDSTIQLPLAGNTWAQNAPARSRIITNAGIEGWTNKNVQFDTYLRVNQTGSLKIKVRAKTEGQSQLQLTINGKKRSVTLNSQEFQWQDAGEWEIKDTGYIKITLAGLSKTGERFADVSNYEISGTAVSRKTAFVKNNEGNFYYWGRRGPSV